MKLGDWCDYPRWWTETEYFELRNGRCFCKRKVQILAVYTARKLVRVNRHRKPVDE